MADRQMAGITGNATMRVPITGNVNVGGSAIRELRFMPRSAFPEVGRSDVLYIDTLGECIYYWNGSEYVQLSGGGSGTDNYNSLQNRPKINNVTLEGEQTSSDLGLQSSIDDLSSIRSGASAGATALQPEDIDTLPTDGSSNPVSSGGTYDFVNSSIATNTAYFIGTFASVAELEAYTGTVTNNDYAFVTSTDSAGNTLYNRYKYNAETQTWSFEYAVNNTAFTTAQWAAIQSGMTSADKTKLDGIEQGANKTVIDASPTSGSDNAVSSGGVHTALSGKQDTIADLSDIRSGASAGATAVQPSALTDYQTKLSGTNKLDPSYIDYDASHRAVSDTEKSTWNGKQDAISDLDTIRSGAAAGATALQQSDVSSTYSATGTAPINGTAVNAAIETLAKSSVGGSGKYISAISETDGKIAAIAETMDTVPTSGSTKAVTSGGVQAPLAEVVDSGAKNIADMGKTNFTTATSHGVTVSRNGDVFTINGTSDTNDNIFFNIYYKDLSTNMVPAGDWVASITPANSKIQLRGGINGSITQFAGYGAPLFLTIPEGTTNNWVRIVAKASTTFNNETFRLMICTKAEWDVSHAYEPYALPNPTLTPAAIKAVDEGAKNRLTVNTKVETGQWTNIPVVLKSGAYVLSIGTLSSTDTDATTCQIGLFNSENQNLLGRYPKLNRGNNIFYNFEINSESAYLRVYSSDSTAHGTGDTVTINDAMICTAADWAVSKKYVPYALPNPTLTPAVIKAVDEGAKNLLRNTASSQVVGGVTFTVNADGTITANGTKTNNDWFYLSVGNSLDAGAYVLSSGLAPQSDMNLRLLIATEDSLGSAIMSAEGARQVHTKQLTSNYTGLYYAIRISSGTTINNVVFKPMLCTAADWAVSNKFVPYAPTNRELYESKADKPDFVSSISSALNSQTDGTICGYVGSSSTIPNVSAEYIVARTYTTDNSLDRRIQIVESAGGARETRYYNGTSWGSWTPV